MSQRVLTLPPPTAADAAHAARAQNLVTLVSTSSNITILILTISLAPMRSTIGRFSITVRVSLHFARGRARLEAAETGWVARLGTVHGSPPVGWHPHEFQAAVAAGTWARRETLQAAIIKG
jgi:hypothetical protein